MPPYQRHVFVCTNRRAEDNPKGCCALKGSEAVLERFKQEARAAATLRHTNLCQV